MSIEFEIETEELVTVNSSWEDLNYEVYNLKAKWPERPIWQMIQEKPVTPESIQDLFNTGWKVFGSAAMRGGRCRYSEGAGMIYISYNLSPFMRDLTLCHEIVHAQYPASLLLGEDYQFSVCQKDNFENELITERYARQLRANPKILRMLAKQFSGENPNDYYVFHPLIYDRASFLAFGLHGYNLDKAMKRCPKPLRELPLLMDIPESDLDIPYPIKDEADYDHYEDLLI